MNYYIFQCCENGDLVGVKRLVEEYGIVLGGSEIQSKHGNTPLHYASFWGHLEIVKYLVEECKVNPDAQDEYGCTPLQDSSRQGYIETVKYFIQHDVDTSIKNNDGNTFLDLFSGEKKDEIEEMMKDLHWKKSNVKSGRF